MARRVLTKLTIKLEGDKAIQRALKAGFRASAIRAFGKRGALAAAQALVKPIKAQAPDGGNGPPAMRKAIKARRSRRKGAAAIVGIKGGKTGVWYGKFVVRGTRPHHIAAGEGFKSLRPINGAFRKGVQHRGAKANPFVVETATRHLDVAQAAFTNTVARLMTEKALRPNARGLRAQVKR